MSKPAQKSAGPLPSDQDPVKSAKTRAGSFADQAKKPAGKRTKSATDKQASSTKGHQ